MGFVKLFTNFWCWFFLSAIVYITLCREITEKLTASLNVAWRLWVVQFHPIDWIWRPAYAGMAFASCSIVFTSTNGWSQRLVVSGTVPYIMTSRRLLEMPHTFTRNCFNCIWLVSGFFRAMEEPVTSIIQ